MWLASLRRAHLAVALAVLAMAGGAVVGEDLCPGGHVLAGCRMALECRPDVIGDRLDFLRLQDAVGAEARHRAVARASGSPLRMPWVTVCWMSSSVPPHSQSPAASAG